MDSIDIVKNLEQAGFTRRQAELQVKTMVDLKKDLMTKKDGEHLNRRMDTFENRMGNLDKRIDSLEESMKYGFTLLRDEIRLQPLRIIIYLVGVVGGFLGIYSYWPMIKNWLQL